MEHHESSNEIDYRSLFVIGICAMGALSVFATISILTYVGMTVIGL